MAATDSDAILTIRGLRKSFGPVEVLRGVDLDLHPGEVLALVGDNGAGKSTLIKHVAGVYRADAGQIMLGGKNIDMSTPRQARENGIETVYQDLALADDLSVGANIFLGREPMRRLAGVLPYVDDRTIRQETAALLLRLGSHIPAQAKTVALLIQSGADPNTKDMSGVAPLHRAVRTRCAAAVEALLAGGADPRLANKTGSTPLQLAGQPTGRGGSGSVDAKAQQAEILRLLARVSETA